MNERNEDHAAAPSATLPGIIAQIDEIEIRALAMAENCRQLLLGLGELIERHPELSNEINAIAKRTTLFTEIRQGMRQLFPDDITLNASTIRAFDDFLWPLVRACRREFVLIVYLSPRLFLDQCLDGMIVHRQAGIPGSYELIRINFDCFNDQIIPYVINFFVSSLIPPFLESIGDISCLQQKKSLMVFLSNPDDREKAGADKL